MTPNPNPSPELKPCPFCGAGTASSEYHLSGVWLEKSDHDEPDYHVHCWSCGGRGNERGDREAAIAAWNTRTLSPPPTITETVTVALPAPGEVERIKQYIADLLSVVQPFALAAERADEINAVRDPDGDRVYPWNYVNPTHFADAFAIYSERLDPDDWEALNDAESSADNAADRYTEDSVRAMLRGTIEGDTLRGWCKAHDVNPTHAYEFADGKRNAPVDLLAAMGLARTIVVAHPSPALATVAAANNEAFVRGVEAAAKVADDYEQHTGDPAFDAATDVAAVTIAERIRLLSKGGGKDHAN